MQAIEIETDISDDGKIRLSESLHKIFGRHARLIVLLDESDATTNTSKSTIITDFRGSGKGGTVERLLMDRQADRAREA